MDTTIKVGPIRFTSAVSLGFVALGFVWACVVNLYPVLSSKQAITPQALTTLTFWVMVFGGVWIFHGLGEKFEAVLDRIRNRGALGMTEDELAQFKLEIRGKSQFAALVGGIGLLLLMVAFYGSAYLSSDERPSVVTLIQYFFEAGANSIVGLFMGRTIVHASLGLLLRKRGVRIAIMPGHPDGAAGMSPIGALFLQQAAVMLLPSLYFVLWWALMTGDSIGNANLFDEAVWSKFCSQWTNVYFIFFVVMMTIQFVGFFAPMCIFHSAMKEQKAKQLVIADQLSDQMNELKSRIPSEEDEAQVKLLKERLADLSVRHDEIEDLPSWPVSVEVRRRFALRNTLVMLPLFMKLWDFIAKLNGG